MKNKFLARITAAAATTLLALGIVAMTSDSLAVNFAGFLAFLLAASVCRVLVVKFGMWSDISE